MIPQFATDSPSPATIEFLEGLGDIETLDQEAVDVFLDIHQSYHEKKIDLERALASCGMILLVRTFTLLQKFVALPRDNSTEAHYRLTLREREDDGFQVIDVQYLDGRISSVALDRALPGGGIYEETDLILEDEFPGDSSPDSESGPEECSTPDFDSPVIREWLTASYRLDLDWEGLCQDAALDSTNSQETGGSKMDLQDPRCDDTLADAEMPLATISGRNPKGAMDAEPGPPTWRPRPIIAPGSSAWPQRLQC